MGEKKKVYRVLNLLRAYCALLIVFIHMGLGSQSAFITCITRQGVPFFFLVSGFFFSKKIRSSENAGRETAGYVKRILCVYFVWILLWLPSTVKSYSGMYPGSQALLIAVLLRRILLAGIAPYWYLLALAESAVLLAVVIRKDCRLLGWVLCIVGLVLNAVYRFEAEFYTNGLVYRVFYTVFSWDCNFIMTGFPLMFLGSLASRREASLYRLHMLPLLILYLLSVAGAFLVYYGLGYVYVFPFAILQAILLLLVGLSPVPYEKAISDKVCMCARNYSSVLFLSHTALLAVFGRGLKLWNTGLRYGLTVVGAFLLLLIVEALKWQPLKKLFMIK